MCRENAVRGTLSLIYLTQIIPVHEEFHPTPQSQKSCRSRLATYTQNNTMHNLNTCHHVTPVQYTLGNTAVPVRSKLPCGVVHAAMIHTVAASAYIISAARCSLWLPLARAPELQLPVESPLLNFRIGCDAGSYEYENFASFNWITFFGQCANEPRPAMR